MGQQKTGILSCSAVRCHLKHTYQNSCSSWELERDPEQPDGGTERLALLRMEQQGSFPLQLGARTSTQPCSTGTPGKEKLLNLKGSMGTNPGVL